MAISNRSPLVLPQIPEEGVEDRFNAGQRHLDVVDGQVSISCSLPRSSVGQGIAIYVGMTGYLHKFQSAIRKDFHDFALYLERYGRNSFFLEDRACNDALESV